MNYLQLKQELRNLAGLPLGGEFQTLVEVSLNAVYRRLHSLVSTSHEERVFTLTTTAKPLPDTPTFSGDGLDDLTAAGAYSGTDETTFIVTVDAASGTDTFKWAQDGGTETTGVAMTGAAQTLAAGVTVTFAATTGHTLADAWTVVVSMYSIYGMDLYVKTVNAIEDSSNKKNIYTVTKRKFADSYPGDTTSGTPTLAQPYGTWGIRKQPETAGVISFVSDSTNDSGSNYIAVITGWNAAGTLIREEVTMNGTTEADSTASFTTIQRVVKAPASGFSFAGNLTIQDTGDNTLGVIPIWWESPDYFWVEFHPRPSTALTYTVSAEMRQAPLVEDEDWPEIDQDYHDLIWKGAMIDLGPKVGMAQYAASLAVNFENRLDEFLSAHGEQPNTQEYLVFGNVWNRAGPRQRPYPPRIPGVETAV